jgi:hypothetical protein
MKKFKIKAIKPSLIELVGENGEQVFISIHKHTIKFLELRGKEIGAEVLINVGTSDKGRLYCTDSLAIEESLFKGEKILMGRELMQLQRKRALADLE